MIPLQTLADPVAMTVIALSIVMIFVTLFGFIWAYGKVRDGGGHDAEPEDAGHGRPGA